MDRTNRCDCLDVLRQIERRARGVGERHHLDEQTPLRRQCQQPRKGAKTFTRIELKQMLRHRQHADDGHLLSTSPIQVGNGLCFTAMRDLLDEPERGDAAPLEGRLAV